MTGEPITLDALLPPAIAARAEDIGVTKARMDFAATFILAVLAGAYIAMGAIFCTTVVTGTGGLPFGIAKLLGGLVFCLGLILVIVAGAELFTGNNLIVMAVASGKIPPRLLLRNWGIVYLGNFAGALATAYIMLLTEQYKAAGGELGATAMKMANAKCALGFLPALTRGIYCNALVCLAVWLCFSCRTTTDKILATIFPITAFVAAGFEHCVANMYFIPMGLFIKGAVPAAETAACTDLTWMNFFVKILLPVTIGNIIGGAFFVGMIYWVIFLRRRKS